MVIAGTLVVALAAGLAGAGAQGQRSARGTTAAEPAAAPMTQADAAELRRSIEELTRQVTALRQEVSRQRAAAPAPRRRATNERQFNADRERLRVIQQEMIERRRQRAELSRQLRDAQDRVDSAQARLGNVQSQLAGAPELDRQAAESRIRRTLERQRDQAQADVADLEREIQQIDDRMTELEQAASTIRGRLGITPDAAADEGEAAEGEEDEEPTVLERDLPPDD